MTDSKLIMKQAKDAVESQKSLVTRIDHYIFQLSPHIVTRESARLLTESRDRLEHYESMLKRLGDEEADFIDSNAWFDSRLAFLEADAGVRIKYANEALK